MARLPEWYPPTPERSEPAPVHPVKPAVQALQGAFPSSRRPDPQAVRVHPLGEESEDLWALLPGFRGPGERLPQWRLKWGDPWGGSRVVDAVRRRSRLEQARPADVDTRFHQAHEPLLQGVEGGPDRGGVDNLKVVGR